MKHSVFYLPVRIFYLLYISDHASMNADNSLIWPVWQQQPIFDEVKNEGKCECPLYYQDNWIVFRNRRNEVNTYDNYN